MEQQAHVQEVPKPENNLHPDTVARGSTTGSPLHLHTERPASVDPLKKVRTSGGHDRSVEQSPMHPRNQAKTSWERRVSSEGAHGSAPGTPGRLKLRTGGRGDESPDRGTTVPKLGDWDENNPSSADGYTELFNKVSQERRGGEGRASMITDDAMYLNSYNQGTGHKSSSCWCFSWCRK